MSATLGLDATRAIDPARHAIAGVAPAAAVRPANRDELSEALRAAARDRLAVVPWGGGVGLGHEAAPPRYDVAIDLAALASVIEYEPEDFTLTAECGVRIADLAATLAARNQSLPLEAAFAARATLGGVLAANASGPRRLRWGAPRDRILGARMALADGTLVRTGGKVVKNVAGYALHRLLCGSRGGLGIVVEASLKLAPAPEVRRALVYRVHAGDLLDRARWEFLPRLEPAWVSVLGPESGGALPGTAGVFTAIVVLEDDAAWVDQQERRVVDRLGDPVAVLEGDDVRSLAERVADLEETAACRLSLTTATPNPAALTPLVQLAAAGTLVFHALAGRLHLFPSPAEVQPLVTSLADLGFALVEARGAGMIAPFPAPQVAARALRTRIRAALDPESRFAYGERWENG